MSADKYRRKGRLEFGLRRQSAAATALFAGQETSKAAWRFASRHNPKSAAGVSDALDLFVSYVFIRD